MRILMFSDYFYPLPLGGGERRMYEIAKRLAKKHEVHVIMRRLAGLASHEKHEGIYIHRVFVPSKGIALESPINGLFFIIASFPKSLRLGNFDVYAPQQFFPLLPAWAASKVKRTPILATIHDVYSSGWIQRYGLRGRLMALFEQITLRLPYTKVTTVSNTSREKLVASRIPREKIEIIPNGVDLEMFDHVSIEKSGRPRIIYVGRLIGYKHVDDLLVAFSRLDLDVELYIVGEGPERKNLEALAKKLKVDHNVTFTGFVDERKKIELLKSSHVLVLPSSTEGFGIAVIEAWASRSAVIVSDIPALHELAEEGKAGLLFKLGDIEDLGAKLKQVLKDKSLQSKLSQNGYDLVREKFAWDKVAGEVEKTFRGIA
ncbi:Glycogen synthase [subsurface metagenome]